MKLTESSRHWDEYAFANESDRPGSVRMTLLGEQSPSVLVGIVTHNRAGVLGRSINSALLQRYPSTQVAVVDDGSTDETFELGKEFPQVRWNRWPMSRGYLEARNELMRSASATYYASLDDDSWFVDGDEIEVAVNHLERNPRVAAVAFDILSPDRDEEAPRAGAQVTASFIGCGHVLRLEAAREVGFYAPNPGSYGGEEKDLCLRLLDRGWEIHNLPGVHVWHEKTTLSRDRVAQHRSGVCNDLVFALRRCPMPSLLWILPLKVGSHLRFALRNRLVRPCLEGIGAFLRNVGEIWPTREPVRAATFSEFRRRSRA